MILIPEEYINADQLKKKVTEPCEVGKNQKVCNQFSYLDVKQQPEFITVEAEFPSKDLPPATLYNDSTVTKELDFNGMAKLSRDQVCVLLLSFDLGKALNLSHIVMQFFAV